ncbi:hypothetical protein WMY93_020346 [Mugilogobius chulae]|uniref:Uncharacterized protein n=1 Tax=Mugilogobius chulae TaxID=88201 RepID=A0AAW0NJN2_9GOBI
MEKVKLDLLISILPSLSSVNRSECLVQEKESLKAALQEALEQVQDQHQKDLEDLEHRLREAHENERRESEHRSREEERGANTLSATVGGSESGSRGAAAGAGAETQRSAAESDRAAPGLTAGAQHQPHTEAADAQPTLQDAEMVLNEKILELTQENKVLMDKLTEEENRRREMSQKDSHTKLMEVDKLTEKSLMLGETLKKVQQENEDLKARMDRHAALSRQLSTEQALLQESLHKESKMNKRLSMENEELMWKLHNGELSSPGAPAPAPAPPRLTSAACSRPAPPRSSPAPPSPPDNTGRPV